MDFENFETGFVYALDGGVEQWVNIVVTKHICANDHTYYGSSEYHGTYPPVVIEGYFIPWVGQRVVFVCIHAVSGGSPMTTETNKFVIKNTW